ncbi:MAG: alanine--glyoxylate aminotransferase family protein [Bdellovibrionota bacterium]
MSLELNPSYPYSLLAPGPVNLHPEVRKILAEPMIHHRTPEFDQILARALTGLKKIFQTEEPVYIHTSTGTGGMESLLVNTLSPGDEVFAIVSGKFGERWAQMAKVFGARVHIHNVSWGQSINPEDLKNHLKLHPNTRAVLCQACETSTGVAHPIQELAEICNQHPSTLLLVDGITAVGAYPLPMDQWKIDGLVAGSQKAFMLPTGMSFVSFSKKAWNFIDNAQMPRFYFDIRSEKKSNANGETFFSSAVPLIKALDFILDLILKKGLTQHFQEIHRRAEATRIFSQKMGFSLYAKNPSDSLTALALPSTIDGQKLRLDMEKKFNITIMGGQDQAKGKIVRLGHMGYIQDDEIVRALESLALSAQKLDGNFISEEKIKSTINELKIWLRKNP